MRDKSGRKRYIMGYQEWKEKIQEQRSNKDMVRAILGALGKKKRSVDRSRRVRVHAQTH